MDPRVRIEFLGDNADLSRSLRESGNLVRNFGQNAVGAARNFSAGWSSAAKQFENRVGGAFKRVEGFARSYRSELRAAALVTTAGLGATIKSATRFEARMREVNSITKQSESDFRKTSQAVKDMAATMESTQGPANLAAGLYDINSAGFLANDGLTVLTASSKAATAGLTTTKIAADGITTVLNAYSLSASDATRVSDVMFKTVELGKTTFPELSSNIGQVATIANQAGVSIEELSAGLAVLTAKGLRTEIATIALRGAITKLMNPSAEQAKLMKSLGIEYGAANIKANGLKNTLEQVFRETGGDKQLIAKIVGDVRALNAVLGLVGEDGGAKYQEAINKTIKSAGAAEDAYDEMSKSTEVQWAKFIAASEAAAVAVGETFLPSATELLTWAGDMVKKFNELEPATKKNVGTVALLSGGVVTLMASFGALSKILGPAIRLIGSWRVAIAAAGAPIVAVAGVMGVAAFEIGGHLNFLKRKFKEAAEYFRAVVEGDWEEALRRSLIFFGNWQKRTSAVLDSMNREFRSNFGQMKDSVFELVAAMELLPGAATSKFTGDVGGLGRSLAGFTKGQAGSVPAFSPALAKREEILARLKASGFDAEGNALQKGGSKKKSSASAAREKTREEKLREELVKSARSLKGSKIEANECAITVRRAAKLSGLDFGVSQKPADAAALARSGIVDSPNPNARRGFANSLSGADIGKFFTDASKAKPGDLVFFQKTAKGYADGIITHVGIITEASEKAFKMIDTSTAAGKIVERDVSTFRPDQLFGFQTPAALLSPQDALAASRGALDDEAEKKAEMRRQGLADAAIAVQLANEQLAVAKEINELSINPPKPTDVVEELGTENLEEYTKAAQRLQELKVLGLSTTRQQHQLNLEALEAFTGTEDQRRQLLLERRDIELQMFQEKENELQRQVERGQVSEEMAIAELERWVERENFRAETKIALLQKVKDQEFALQSERGGAFENFVGNMSNTFQQFLVQSLSGQQSFSDTFKNLWKSIKNTFITEIAQMIVKSKAFLVILTAIKKLLGGIFGGFGGFLHGGGDVGGSIASIPFGGKFHSGGNVGVRDRNFFQGLQNLLPDEVPTILLKGEGVIPPRANRRAGGFRRIMDFIDAGIFDRPLSSYKFHTGGNVGPNALINRVGNATDIVGDSMVASTTSASSVDRSIHLSMPIQNFSTSSRENTEDVLDHLFSETRTRLQRL